MAIDFKITHRDGKARVGVISTKHGEVRTPTITVNFTPALLRTGLTPKMVRELGVDLVLVNTVHSFRDKVADIHEFLDWDGPVMADSGGFQMISLADKLNITNEGVEFEIDGERLFFTPEKVLDIQRRMGVDLMMPLDYVVSVRQKSIWAFVRSVLRTSRWFAEVGGKGDDNLYYIVQGGTSSLARYLSVRDANRWLRGDVRAVALGGISLGETPKEIYDTVKFCCDRLVENRPRHLLGVGRPQDIVECIERGVDTFDCVAHTREARHGRVWTMDGYFDLTKSQFKDDTSVLEGGCDCPTCVEGKTRASLRERLKAGDKQAQIDLMLHNIRLVMRLTEEAREAIKDGSFAEFKQKRLKG